MKTVSDIRNTFLDYYAKQGHTVVPSAPLVPQNDPTLMFTAAGMVPFKDYFTGKATPPYTRAASAQKCVRAGGKHNDLENVGYTARHHTFFEMMGNFSFGDYFKEEAISYAWEVISKGFQLPKEKLLVTVYHTDDEAINLWKKIAGFSDDKIIRIATSDNFWSAGDTGPCGPCTEIFYDYGDHVAGGPPGSPDEDGDRFVEFWNLVFMQYDQVDGKQVPLPKPSIDTGMGLERMSSIIQGKNNNYDIDLFQSIIHDIQDRTHTKGTGEALISQRVIADHLRASSFLIADGVLPSNEGRGYVLRRIMRRAMRHAHLLGAKDPLMNKLVPTLVSQMGQAYPELGRAEVLIKDTLYREENKFRETLAKGLKLLDDEMSKLSSGGKLAGDVAFKLYDTFGFPVDLTNDVLVRKGYALDADGFETAMEKQKEMGRSSWTGAGGKTTDKIWFDVQSQIGDSEFLGYNTLKSQAVIKAIVKEGVSVDHATGGDNVSIVLSQTPFYAESGGQVGDSGQLTGDNGFSFSVITTQKPIGSFHAHQGKVKFGTIKVGDAVEAVVNEDRRHILEAHHSATHLLHEALRQELGEHIAQKGSLVEPDRLRLDFSQPDPITDEQLEKITQSVRAQIRANTAVNTRVMSLDEARETGARALFGEKYGDEVRVVSMGSPDDNGKSFSVELCGGTHIKNTGEIGAFRIISEAGVSSGVRRIQAVVGAEAELLAAKENALLNQLANQFKTTITDLPERVQKLIAENQELKTEIGSLRKKVALGGGGAAQSDASEQAGMFKLLAKSFDDLPAKDLKPLADQFKKQLGSGVVVLLSKAEGRASLVVGVTDDITAKVSAVDLVRVAAEALGGKGGGGRPDMAQAGGPDANAADSAFDQIRQHLAKIA
jgi:alanyl-tRNA synthetase